MASGGDAPDAPDPAVVLGLQNQYNRTNQANPFGTARWSTDENGHETLTQSPSSQMQGAIDRAFGYSATPSQRIELPTGYGQLASALMSRVGARYGLGDANPNNPTIGFGMQDSGAPTHGAGGQFDPSFKSSAQQPSAPQGLQQPGQQMPASAWGVGNPQMQHGGQQPLRQMMGG